MSATEAFSPATGAWAALGPLASKRFNCAGAALDGKAYVVGGTPDVSSHL